jgi:hypothetical protein
MDDGRGLGGFEVASRAVTSPSPPPPVKGGTHTRPLGLHVPITHHPSPTCRPVPVHQHHHHLRALVLGGDMPVGLVPHYSTVNSDRRFVHMRLYHTCACRYYWPGSTSPSLRQSSRRNTHGSRAPHIEWLLLPSNIQL